MCDKHEPVLIYDTGGTQLVCGKCGKAMGDWKSNGGGKMHPPKDSKKVGK